MRISQLAITDGPIARTPIKRAAALASIGWAQGSRPGSPYPLAGTPPTAGTVFSADPMTVANVVHTWQVLGVASSGALLVNADGAPLELQLWPIAIPPQSLTAGANARRYLESLVGRGLQFSFREHDNWADSAARAAQTPPLKRAYTNAAATMVKRGLARYCPEAGVNLPALERLEQEAKAQSLGLWSARQPFSCPQ